MLSCLSADGSSFMMRPLLSRSILMMSRMLNGVLEYVGHIGHYKIKVPPWCAVLREAWRTLSLQRYENYYYKNKLLLKNLRKFGGFWKID